MKNRFKLDRYIPADIRRKIRKCSGFGCVICSNAIVTYEHIDPLFSDAHEHDPDRMCLLCGGCQDKVTRGLIGKDVVFDYYKEVQQGRKTRPFDQFHFRSDLSVGIGTLHASYTPVLIQIDGQPLLSIRPPEIGSNVPRLSGVFTDNMGREIFQINDNIWAGSFDCWDIEVIGPKIIVRTAPRVIALELKLISSSEISVSRLNMRWGNAHFIASKKEIAIGHFTGMNAHYLVVGGYHVDAAQALIDIDSNTLSSHSTGFSMNKDGLRIHGTGITLGKNARGAMKAREIKVYNINSPGEIFV